MQHLNLVIAGGTLHFGKGKGKLHAVVGSCSRQLLVMYQREVELLLAGVLCLCQAFKLVHSSKRPPQRMSQMQMLNHLQVHSFKHRMNSYE